MQTNSNFLDRMRLHFRLQWQKCKRKRKRRRYRQAFTLHFIDQLGILGDIFFYRTNEELKSKNFTRNFELTAHIISNIWKFVIELALIVIVLNLSKVKINFLQ